jgi:hypothetical protein
MEKVFLAKVVEPSLTRRVIRCKCCDISYTGLEYAVLIKYEKIVYFDFYVTEKAKNVVCSDCLLFYSSYFCIKHGVKKLQILINDGNDEKMFSSTPIELEKFEPEILYKLKNLDKTKKK